MSSKLLESTMERMKSDVTMKALAQDNRKEINHHIFRAATLFPFDIVRMFEKVQQKYQERPDLCNSINWLQHQKKIFHCFLLTYVAVHNRKIMEITKGQWSMFSDLFGAKNILLLQYQGKIIQKSQERVRWTDFQENLLHQCISNESHPKWTELSRDIFIKSGGAYFKTPKQCRQHWNNHLNLNIYREGWTLTEDIILLDFVAQKGRRWAKLAPLLRHKRTEHMIKNRYHSMLTYARKILKGRQETDKSEKDLIIFFKELLENKQNCREEFQQRNIDNFDHINESEEEENSEENSRINQPQNILKAQMPLSPPIHQIFPSQREVVPTVKQQESFDQQSVVLKSGHELYPNVIWSYPCFPPPQQMFCYGWQPSIFNGYHHL